MKTNKELINEIRTLVEQLNPETNSVEEHSVYSISKEAIFIELEYIESYKEEHEKPLKHMFGSLEFVYGNN